MQAWLLEDRGNWRLENSKISTQNFATCLPYTHKVSIILHIFHDTLWGLIRSRTPWGFTCFQQIGNVGNCVITHDIFTVLRATCLPSWTWYSWSVHFLHILALIHHAILRYGSERPLGVSLSRLISLFKFKLFIDICLSYPDAPGSFTAVIHIETAFFL